ncbi:probable CCR4-associated factor 1 homolog 1 [Pistacia vera]|uniref:probable CCR4-associated factor 1 homolog 1 n=1 Tax=Pistacia vera TaxID=55513 RepID=UPI00126327BE|nr:probable CCR4-associated factor 1 homolog 1 [Pistacia vera]
MLSEEEGLEEEKIDVRGKRLDEGKEEKQKLAAIAIVVGVHKEAHDLRYNVDNTKIIQLGITLSDEDGNVGGTWEFNFSDFDMEKDSYMETSIQLLETHGLDLNKIKKNGCQAHISKDILTNYISFQEMHGGEPSMCQEVRLSKLAKVLEIKRIGEPHNAGSDNFLTATIYARMTKCCGFKVEVFDGFLYGMKTSY